MLAILHPMQRAITQAANDGLPVTLAGSVSATVFWGLHISDIAVIVSALAAVLGVVLQFYVAMRRIHIVEQEMAVSKLVVGAVAQAQRNASVKSQSNSDRIGDVEQKLGD